MYDVIVIGGGPAGFAAALTLGRARRKVLLLEAGPPRNAAAVEMHGFVTRDGVAPAEFRRLAREELAPYGVEIRDARAERIEGEKGAFRVVLSSGEVEARRVLLAVGMVDQFPAIPGYAQLWGESIFQCPYCHGFEVRDRAFGFLAPGPEWLEWALFLRSWSKDLIVFTDGRFEVPAESRARLDAAGISIEERKIERLVGGSDGLEAVELADGAKVARDVLFSRPPQRPTELVAGAGIELNEGGFVKVSEKHETSRPGIYAAGDLTTPLQGAQVAAGAGTSAAWALNHELAIALATGAA